MSLHLHPPGLLLPLPQCLWNAKGPFPCPRLIPPPPPPWDPINHSSRTSVSFFRLALSYILICSDLSCLQGNEDLLDRMFPLATVFAILFPSTAELLKEQLCASCLSPQPSAVWYVLPMETSLRGQSPSPPGRFRSSSHLPFLSHLVLRTGSSFLEHPLSVTSRATLFPTFPHHL